MRELTSLQYLKLDVCNNFYIGRRPWDELIDWTTVNDANLEKLSGNAKHPIIYRKAVRALRTVQAGKPTNYVMGLDATSSGIQVMACLSGCKSTARAVNLINTGTPENVYESVAAEMCKLDVKVDGEMLKIPIMTFFYGSREQPEAVFGEDTPELEAFYTVLQTTLLGAYNVMRVIQNSWQPYQDAHAWTLPDRHEAVVPVISVEEKNIEIDELNHLRMAYRTRIQRPQEHSKSLPANVVHSIDGWICREMILRCYRQGFQMAPVHDCFYASPIHMNMVRKNYRDIMAELCRKPLLQTILREIRGDNIVIEKASDDLDTLVMDAEYPLC